MSKLRFYIRANWDDEAQVYFSDSNIIGLHIEAVTLEEFEELAEALAPTLVMENHLTKNDLTHKSWADMMPAIFFKPPTNRVATA